MSDKEKRGIYNVSFNEKRAVTIKTDIEIIEDIVIQELIYYVKGFHDERRDSGLGAEHIKLHLEQGSEGEITLEELVNIGNSLREYLKNFKKPFIDNDGRKIYEWENSNGIRFRVVNDYMSEKTIKSLQQRGGLQPPLSPSDAAIITFYSDRNLNERMEFKNPKVKEYYENLEYKTPNKKAQIFTLCEQLARLLDDKEAIADLNLLYKKHPEMFKDMQEVSNTIKEVVSEPEIIVKNPTPMSEKDFIAAKKLNDEKMGEVGIRKDKDIAKIFHANNKRLKNLDLLAKKEIVFDGRDAHTPYTQAQSLDGRLVENNISSNTSNNIPNPTLKNTESPNIQSFLGIDYTNINKHTQDKFAHIEQKTNENLAQVSSLDNLAMSKLIEQSEKDLNLANEKENKEKEANKINIERKKK